MSDPTSSAALPLHDNDSPREAKIEALLLTGLDEYFRGDYELAISRWTRVLFLDRGHARAKAYIERARCTLAERQRESEELLHAGLAAFDRGDVAVARQLLSSSVEHGGPHEAAVALLARIDRLDPLPLGPQLTATPAIRTRMQVPTPAPAPAAQARPRRKWLVVGLVGLTAVAMYAAASWRILEPSALLPRRPPLVGSAPPAALPLPSRATLAMERARRLFDRGHLHEALAALEVIPESDPLRPEADAVKSAIQRVLLAGAEPGTGSPPPASSGSGGAGSR